MYRNSEVPIPQRLRGKGNGKLLITDSVGFQWYSKLWRVCTSIHVVNIIELDT